MRIGDLIVLSKKYNLSFQVNPEDPYIIISRELQFGRKSMWIKRYISYNDFEILEDCMKFINDDIDREEEKIINEYNRI